MLCCALRQGRVLTRIRVLIAELPRMLREIVRHLIESEEDMEIGAELEEGATLTAEVELVRPDVVILGLSDPVRPQGVTALLEHHPFLKVLGVGSDGRRAWLYELRPEKRPLGELSPADLVRAIRDSARENARRLLERL